METSVKDIDAFKEEVKRTAINNVINKFPEKVLQLTALLKDERFKPGFKVAVDLPLIPVPQENVTKAKPTGEVKPKDETTDQSSEDSESVSATTPMVESNRDLVEMVAIIEPQMLEFTEYTLSLSAAITLLMPPIEDGNNFGVEIQQECYDTVLAAENEINHRMMEISRYFNVRAELVTKAMKHSNCEDYRFAIREKDRMFHKFLVISMHVIRNHYMNLHDLIVKNMNKIKKPKSSVSKDLLY